MVELFQSQGCSSCPPAKVNVNALVDRPDVLALSFAMTYWDQLGWKDTFATPAYTARQWDHAHAGSRAQLDRTIAEAGPARGGPAPDIAVPIRAGENGGRTLPHRDIVRQLVRLGDWNGKAATFALPAAAPGLRSGGARPARQGGPITAARKI